MARAKSGLMKEKMKSLKRRKSNSHSKKSVRKISVSKTPMTKEKCMKMKVKDMKKSKYYKDLKVKGKSKLKKKELCDLFKKKSVPRTTG